MSWHEIEYLYRDPEREKNVALVTLQGSSRVIIGLAYSDHYEVVSGSGVFLSMDWPDANEEVKRVELNPGDEFKVDSRRFYRLEGDLVMLRTSPTFREEFALADPPEEML